MFNVPLVVESHSLITVMLWLYNPCRLTPSYICHLVDACIPNMPLNITLCLSSTKYNDSSLRFALTCFYFRLKGKKKVTLYLSRPATFFPLTYYLILTFENIFTPARDGKKKQKNFKQHRGSIHLCNYLFQEITIHLRNCNNKCAKH